MQRHNDKRGLCKRNVGQSGRLAAAPILSHFCSNLSCNYGIQTTDRPPSPRLLKPNGSEIPTWFEVNPTYFSAVLINARQFLLTSKGYLYLGIPCLLLTVRGSPSGRQLAFSHFAGLPARPVPLANVTHFPPPLMMVVAAFLCLHPLLPTALSACCLCMLQKSCG